MAPLRVILLLAGASLLGVGAFILHTRRRREARKNKPKIIHLIRHAESEFNRHYENTSSDPMIPDAPITPKGVNQATALRKTLSGGAAGELHPPPEVVMASPLTRALQTAVVAFPDANVEVEPLIREWLTDSCDIGRDPGELSEAFPAINFDKLPGPVWWYTDPEGPAHASTEESLAHFRDYGFFEKEHMVEERLQQLLGVLRGRPEESFALVGHGDIFNLLASMLDPGRGEVWLDNCGVATLTIPPLNPKP
mmetsp:Transcript_54051/g.171512  ORF Transcript_54051/g.171512 Transcript_54051/m.171512 type:complete len:252 (+) Transcript_54051:89-844(+)